MATITKTGDQAVLTAEESSRLNAAEQKALLEVRQNYNNAVASGWSQDEINSALTGWKDTANSIRNNASGGGFYTNYNGTYAGDVGSSTPVSTTPVTGSTFTEAEVQDFANQKANTAAAEAEAAAKKAQDDANAKAIAEIESAYKKKFDDLSSQISGYQTTISDMTAAQKELASRQEKELADYKTSAQEQYDLIKSQYDSLAEQQKLQNEQAAKQQVDALQRSYEDSITTYEQERAKNALAAAQARDNTALYNAKAGDKGGLGSRMMESEAAYYDNQLMNIDLAQAQNKTETERAVADAIAQGDYATAQALLEVGIQKQNALLNQYNTVQNTILNTAGSVDSFYLSQRGQDINQRGNELSYFTNLLGMGIFDAAAAEELGVPADQAQEYADYVNKINSISKDMAVAQLETTLKGKQSSGTSSSTATTGNTYIDPMQKMIASGIKDADGAYRWLVSNGYNDTTAQQIAAQFSAYYNDAHNAQSVIDATTNGNQTDYSSIGNKHGDSWVYVDGVGRLTYQELLLKVEANQIVERLGDDGKYYYTKA